VTELLRLLLIAAVASFVAFKTSPQHIDASPLVPIVLRDAG